MKNEGESVFQNINIFFLIGGLTVGDPVLRSGKPLSVELGPGKVYTI